MVRRPAAATNEAAWKAAHSRLYDHLRRTTREGKTPTLAALAPLYHAIAHGCRAGRYQEALDEVYRKRICRRRLDDGQTDEFYAVNKLGAIGSSLAAISWLFDRPYETPAAAVAATGSRLGSDEAGLGLCAQGRLQEALPAMRASLQMDGTARDWKNAAISALNLSVTELLVGEVAAAVATAEKSIALADRATDAFSAMVVRVTQADALHAAGEWEKAEGLFADAERRQQEQEPEYPLLYSMQAIGTATCSCLRGGPPRRATGRRKPSTLRGGTAGFLTLGSTV